MTAHLPPRTIAIDPERYAAENAREHDTIVGMLNKVDQRVDEHEALLGRDGQALKQLVSDAVAQAIVQVASDPKLWASIRAAMVTQTREAAGGWLLGGLSSIGTKAFWVVVVGVGLYLMGGWGLVLKAAKAIGATP